jgi:hypothetical protein
MPVEEINVVIPRIKRTFSLYATKKAAQLIGLRVYRSVLPDGWEEKVHPEGQQIFYNADKVLSLLLQAELD